MIGVVIILNVLNSLQYFYFKALFAKNMEQSCRTFIKECEKSLNCDIGSLYCYKNEEKVSCARCPSVDICWISLNLIKDEGERSSLLGCQHWIGIRKDIGQFSIVPELHS